MKANIRNASNAVYERNTCVLCSVRSDTCVLYAARFLLLIDAISTLKSRRSPYRFDSSVFLFFPLALSVSFSQIFSHFSSSKSWFTLVLCRFICFTTQRHRMCVRCEQYYHHESLKLHMSSLSMIYTYTTYTSAIENICRSLSTLTYSILIILMFN